MRQNNEKKRKKKIMAYNSVLFAVGNGVSCSHESLSTEERSLKSASCPVSGKSE